MLHCWTTIAGEEGARVLYSGLAPALLRQAVYGTIKYGLYYSIKDYVGGKESTLKNVSFAVIAGSVSASIANPTDVLKVRMQSRSAPVVSPKNVTRVSMYNCFKDMYIREGRTGLYRGVVPTAQRAAVVAGVQLPVYDWTKLFMLKHNLLPGESAWNHLLSSFCAGLCACLASSPVDVIRTRIMDQRRLRAELPKAKLRAENIYKSSLECGLATVRNEGVTALYKGFVPAFMRMGPWNIIFFLVYERLKQLTGGRGSTTSAF
jgi:solute carrier family 25 protein 14/30